MTPPPAPITPYMPPAPMTPLFMPDAEYFAHPAISNSKLTDFQKKITGRQDDFDPTEAFAFGSLIDAMITEPERVGFGSGTFDGKTAKDFDVALKMRKSFFANKYCAQIIHSQDVSFQSVFIADRNLEYNGVKFTQQHKCKYDFYGTISGDIKSTTATTLDQFYTACGYFGYWRSRAFYMDITGKNTDILIGISKKNFKVFLIPIKRGDNNYNKGRNEYLDLCLKYDTLAGFM